MKKLLLGVALLTSMASFANQGVEQFCSDNLPVLKENIRYADRGETVNSMVNILAADGAEIITCKDYITREDIVVVTYPDGVRHALLFATITSPEVKYLCSKDLPVPSNNIRVADKGETVNSAVNILAADGAKTITCLDYVTRESIVVATYPDGRRYALLFKKN